MSKIHLVDEIVIDYFWHPKLRKTVWRVTVEFTDGSTPFRKFTQTKEGAYSVANHYWKEVEAHCRSQKALQDDGEDRQDKRGSE